MTNRHKKSLKLPEVPGQRKHVTPRALIGSLILATGLGSATASFAQVLDPQVTMCAVGDATCGTGLETNPLTSPTQLDIYQQGQAAFTSTFTLIFGVPVFSDLTTQSLTPNSVQFSISGTNKTPPLTAFTSSGTYTSSANKNVYAFLGLSFSDNSNNSNANAGSESWANWSDQATYLTPYFPNETAANLTGFNLYELAVTLTGANLPDNIQPPLLATFTNSLPDGTIIIAYENNTDLNGNTGDWFTPWTNAGVVVPCTGPDCGVIHKSDIPEPSTIALMGIGIALPAMSRRRNRNSDKPAS